MTSRARIARSQPPCPQSCAGRTKSAHHPPASRRTPYQASPPTFGPVRDIRRSVRTSARYRSGCEPSRSGHSARYQNSRACQWRMSVTSCRARSMAGMLRGRGRCPGHPAGPPSRRCPTAAAGRWLRAARRARCRRGGRPARWRRPIPMAAARRFGHRRWPGRARWRRSTRSGQLIAPGSASHEGEVRDEHRILRRRKTLSSQKSPCASCCGRPAPRVASTRPGSMWFANSTVRPAAETSTSASGVA
jgi:hypothetical protein